MMKTSCKILALALFGTMAHAFVIPPPTTSSSSSSTMTPQTTTGLHMSVGSKWVTDPVTKCRVEVPEDHYTMRASVSPEEYWPYNPWGGIGQTMFFPPGAVDTSVGGDAGLYFPGGGATFESSSDAGDGAPAQLPEADPTRAMPDTSVSAYAEALKQQTS